ncbi:nucleotidyltransferase domain-containing protein [Solibacillus silvestris]
MGLETKNKERDLSLPKHRQELMEAIELDLISDENVLAIFYGGSIGSGETDLYSDIDLRIVVKDGVYEEYRLNKKQRAKNWGKVLFFEDFHWANYSTAHSRTFIKVDSFYYKSMDIKPSIWLQKLKIVHDPTRLIQDVLTKSAALTYRPSVHEIEHWRTKFFAYLHEAYRRVMRNEIYYALHNLDNLRLSLVTGWYMEEGIQPNTFGDWAKLEGDRSKLNERQLSLLIQWQCSREQDDILNVMKSIIREFIPIHKKLCEQYGIDENSDWVTEILNMVM